MFALLDGTSVRVRTMVAPAGYGKTTLAEQWVERDGRRGVWYRARTASTDVAALALGIAQSCTAVVPDCDERLRAHLRALPAPAENVTTLAEIIADDLAAWPEDAWLVVDDYHEIAEEPKGEHFIAALVASSSLNFLIASRQRPSWVTTKLLLYGEVLEITQTALAMDNHEAAEVLVERSEASASGLVSLANGWPALIGMTSVTSAEIDDTVDLDSGSVAESLYRFFADEVLGALGPEVRQGLTTLAVAPIIDRGLATVLLGSEDADTVCAAALEVGILVERERQLDLHPLARTFLAERGGELGLEPADDSVVRTLAYYAEHRRWDAVLEVLLREGPVGDMAALMRAALDELLETARLSTVQRWCELAAAHGMDAAIFAIARAELMLRHGSHIEAIAHAEAAAAQDPSLAYRANLLAGRAAHIASREEQALGLFERAEELAETGAERRDARWGQLMCIVELESPAASDFLSDLQGGVTFTDARDVVRAATCGLSYQVKLGNLDLEDADVAATLLHKVRDPLAVSAFQSTYAAALGLVCRYGEAVEVASQFLDTIQTYRLDFARPYAYSVLALGLAGLRQLDDAARAAENALGLSRALRDGNAQQISAAQLIRVLLQQGRAEEAAILELPHVRRPLPAVEAELVSVRALVLASLDRLDEALAAVESVRHLSRGVEAAVLIPAVEAICSLKRHDERALSLISALEETTFQRGALDLLVTVYRSFPELLRVLLKTSQDRDRLEAVVRRAGDEDLSWAVGTPVRDGSDRRAWLSRREKEVYELIADGLTNREIGKVLFIEESTVKAHTHRIYEKLQTNDRTAIRVKALLERASQATSATGLPATESPRDETDSPSA